MRYASAPPFRQALEERLGAASRAGGPSLARLRYGERSLASTWVKDLVDVVLIAGEAALDAGRRPARDRRQVEGAASAESSTRRSNPLSLSRRPGSGQRI
jgi:hypothetical protein